MMRGRPHVFPPPGGEGVVKLESSAVQEERSPWEMPPVMPQHIETEQAMLGIAMASDEKCRLMLEELDEEDFAESQHRLIFAAIAEACEEFGGANTITVGARLHDRGQLDICGGHPYLTCLTESYETTAHYRRHAYDLRERRIRRDLMALHAEGYRRAQKGDVEAREVLSWADGELARLRGLRLAREVSDPTRAANELRECYGNVHWLWPEWLPLGHLTVLVAAPGVGKSALALHLARCLWEVGEWPDGAAVAGDPAPTLLCDTEANVSQMLDRIQAWGMAEEGVRIWPAAEHPFDLADPDCLATAEAAVKRHGCRMLVIDALGTAFSGDENSTELGRVLGPWLGLAARARLALVVVHHERKRQPGERSGGLERVRGSSSLAALARSIISLRPADRLGERIEVSALKSSFTRKPEPLIMVIDGHGLSFDSAPTRAEEPLKIERAQQFLLHALRDGPRWLADLREAAQGEGIHERTLFRAARELQLRRELATDAAGRRGALWHPPAGGGQGPPTD